MTFTYYVAVMVYYSILGLSVEVIMHSFEFLRTLNETYLNSVYVGVAHCAKMD